MFTLQEYTSRRATIQSKFQDGILLFMGNEDSPMNYLDNAYRFRQDSTFRYYFGINNPGLAALIDIENDKIIVFGDEMSIDAIVWMGRLKTLKAKAADVGIVDLRPSAELAKYLAKTIAKVRILPPYRGENRLKLSALLGCPINQLDEYVSVQFIKAVVAQRSIKSAAEIKELHYASDISADMHLAAMQVAKPGMRESEVAAAIHQVALAADGDISYPIILTINGHVLHNHHHHNLIKEGQMVLNDSGAETPGGYAGDLTRTFPVGKKFTPLQQNMYELVLKSYNDSVNLLKPGVRYLDVHYKACLTLSEGLKSMGLMKGDMQDAVMQGAHALFFQCGTGHMMGMDVHDMEDLGEQYVGYTESLKKETSLFGLKSLRLGKELEEGYVLTVEPGLYFIPELIDLWKAGHKFEQFINYGEVEKFRNFSGIRVEDDYVITDSGFEKLGKELAISVNDVEEIRASAY